MLVFGQILFDKLIEIITSVFYHLFQQYYFQNCIRDTTSNQPIKIDATSLDANAKRNEVYHDS